MNLRHVFATASRRGLVAAVLGLAAGWATLSAAVPWQVRRPASRNWFAQFLAVANGPDAARPGEQAFLQDALDNCREQMRLGELATSQASSPDVRAIGLQMGIDLRQVTDGLEALQRR